MQIFNSSHIKEFYQAWLNLDLRYHLLTVFCLLITIAYPGHNYLQTLTIKPGPVTTYDQSTLPLADYPQSDGAPPPQLSARSVVVQDLGSKAMIYSYQEDTLLMPASTTKLMTAIISLDHYSLTDTLTVQNEDRAIGSSIGLVSGEAISVKDLLSGLLIGSGNDAALALADNYPGGYWGFVSAMNTKAHELHLDNTTFRNPSGVENYAHLTTARDLAVLASYALTNQTIRSIINTKQLTIVDSSGEITHHLKNTNQLLGELEGVQGMKTGWTENAGECLVTYVEREGREVIIVVLGSLDRFGDTKELVDWIYSHHTWVMPE